MVRKDLAFEEWLYTEYDLRKRTGLVIILSAILYLSFLVLDAIYAAKFFQILLIIRLIVLFAHVVLFFLLSRVHTNHGYVKLAIALTIFDVAGIAIMIQILGGFVTMYVQGLYLIIMGMVVVVPLVFRISTILYIMIWASYVIPGLINMQGGNGDWRDVFTNLFFLSSIVLIGIFGSYIMDSIRRRELSSRVQLEETSARLQESNAKLKTLDELKTQFFANVNHELRTPLTLMMAPLDPLIAGQMGKISVKNKKTLSTIKRNGFKLLKLINNLLDLSKLEEGKMRLKIKTIDFVEYINSLLASVKPLADNKDIKLYFQHPSQKLKMSVDPDQFEKVVLNLLSNAIKFTQENGRITVFIEEDKSKTALIVEDTGRGIPKDMLKTIFDRFSQVDGSLSRSHEGTGIGLSLVNEIVKVHGGKVHAESREGKGAKFIVDLKKGDKHYPASILDRRVEDRPGTFKKRATDEEDLKVQDVVSDFRNLQLVDLEKVEVEKETVELDKSHEHLILVIDDNPEVLKLMKILLQDEYALELVLSAEEGIKLMREKKPDIVLCDVMMPGMDGHTFCRKVKSDEWMKHIPVLLVTARAGSEMMAQGIDSGADDYIAKPFDSTELKARIRSLLRIREAESELSLANQNLKMHKKDLIERQQSLFVSMIKSLVSAIDAKDEYTRHHSARVTDIALKIASKMDFNTKELKDLELASLLHDVGKIAIPESILNKEGRLSDEEYTLIKEHPARGESILKPVVELKEISRIVRAHHERYDGAGYPDGLKGHEIPLSARIMAVADTYDSMTSNRPYRKGMSHHFSVKEIVSLSGKQFDPEVIEHFIEVSNELHNGKAGKKAGKTERPQ